jgi:hypothetical protein
LYEESRLRPIVLYTTSDSPYSLAKSTANFYRPDNLTVKSLNTVEELRAAVPDEPGSAFFFVRSFQPPEWMAAGGITCTPVVRTIPDWLARHNVNNWLARMYVWTVFAVSRNPAGRGP